MSLTAEWKSRSLKDSSNERQNHFKGNSRSLQHIDRNQMNVKQGFLPNIVNEVVQSPGQPLDNSVRVHMEESFGYDFSNIRIHSDSKAAESAQKVNALSYTVGQDVAFNRGQYLPHSARGQSLLAHELSHVIQQSRDGSHPSRFAGNQSNEMEATHASMTIRSGGRPTITGSSGVGIARAPRSLEVSLDPGSLSFTELEGEIKEIQQHLDANPVSNPENDHLMEVQNQLQKELAKRRKQEAGGGKRRRDANISATPRSLTESLRIDETLTDTELYAEIDSIHSALGTKISKADRANLKTALAQLDSEKARREGVAAAEVRAEKIQRAFTPKVTSTDGEALSEVMGTIESIRISENASGLYTLIREGEVLSITQEEYDKIRNTAKKILQDRLGRVRRKAEDAVNQYEAQAKVNEEHPIVSGAVHFFGGIDDPGGTIFLNQTLANTNASMAQSFIEQGALKLAAEHFAVSEKFATIAKKASQSYVDEIISTAETTVSVLEITRDAAFATTLALGAVVAAPVIAAGATGLGLTGVSATAATALGTGTVVGTGGAILRGGSAAGGVALAGGSKEEVWAAAKKEGKRGFKEGAASGVGGGVARAAGIALKAGQSTSTVVNIARGSLAQGLGGAAGSATSTKLEGGSAIDVLKSGAKGFGVGAATGPLSYGASAIKNPVLNVAGQTLVGGGVTGGLTYLETGSKEEAFKSAAIGGASSLAVGLAKPSNVTRAEQKAFEVGQVTRSKIGNIVSTLKRPVESPIPARSLGPEEVAVPPKAPEEVAVPPKAPEEVAVPPKAPEEVAVPQTAEESLKGAIPLGSPVWELYPGASTTGTIRGENIEDYIAKYVKRFPPAGRAPIRRLPTPNFPTGDFIEGGSSKISIVNNKRLETIENGIIISEKSIDLRIKSFQTEESAFEYLVNGKSIKYEKLKNFQSARLKGIEVRNVSGRRLIIRFGPGKLNDDQIRALERFKLQAAGEGVDVIYAPFSSHSDQYPM